MEAVLQINDKLRDDKILSGLQFSALHVFVDQRTDFLNDIQVQNYVKVFKVISESLVVRREFKCWKG